MILGIDIGSRYTCAAVSVNGHVVLLKPPGGLGSVVESGKFPRLRELFGFYKDQAVRCFDVHIKKVRIACPCGCEEEVRQELIQAAEEAELQAETVEAPVAAAKCFSKICGFGGCDKILVCDFGSAGFSAAIVEKQGEAFAVQSWLNNDISSGAGFEVSLRDELAKRLASRGAEVAQEDYRALLNQESQRAMHRLSMEAETTVRLPGPSGFAECVISRMDFNMMVGGRIWKAVRLAEGLAREAGTTLKQMDQVVSVGGCAQIPYVMEILERAAARKVIRLPDPKAAVCCGAALE